MNTNFAQKSDTQSQDQDSRYGKLLAESMRLVGINGEICLDEALVNKIWKPVLLEHLSQLADDLKITLKEGCITIDLVGRVKGVLFMARYTVRVKSFEFHPGAHRAILEVQEEITGSGDLVNRFLVNSAKVVFKELLGQKFALGVLLQQPGIEAEGDLLRVDLEKMDWFREAAQKEVWGLPVLSLIRLTLGGISGGKLSFGVQSV